MWVSSISFRGVVYFDASVIRFNQGVEIQLHFKLNPDKPWDSQLRCVGAFYHGRAEISHKIPSVISKDGVWSETLCLKSMDKNQTE